MLHLPLDWEYPHWMMLAGAILVAAGFIGLAFHRNRNVETDQKKLGRERPTPSNILEPEGDDLPEDGGPEDVPLFLRSDKHWAWRVIALGMRRDPERAVPDWSRKLARAAIAKYWIHHEAAARAGR
jgi:hypothetical protein